MGKVRSSEGFDLYHSIYSLLFYKSELDENDLLEILEMLSSQADSRAALLNFKEEGNDYSYYSDDYESDFDEYEDYDNSEDEPRSDFSDDPEFQIIQLLLEEIRSRYGTNDAIEKKISNIEFSMEIEGFQLSNMQILTGLLDKESFKTDLAVVGKMLGNKIDPFIIRWITDKDKLVNAVHAVISYSDSIEDKVYAVKFLSQRIDIDITSFEIRLLNDIFGNPKNTFTNALTDFYDKEFANGNSSLVKTYMFSSQTTDPFDALDNLLRHYDKISSPYSKYVFGSEILQVMENFEDTLKNIAYGLNDERTIGDVKEKFEAITQHLNQESSVLSDRLRNNMLRGYKSKSLLLNAQVMWLLANDDRVSVGDLLKIHEKVSSFISKKLDSVPGEDIPTYVRTALLRDTIEKEYMQLLLSKECDPKETEANQNLLEHAKSKIVKDLSIILDTYTDEDNPVELSNSSIETRDILEKFYIRNSHYFESVVEISEILGEAPSSVIENVIDKLSGHIESDTMFEVKEFLESKLLSARPLVFMTDTNSRKVITIPAKLESQVAEVSNQLS